MTSAGKEAKMVVQKKPSYAWWFGSHKNSRNSPWLSSTLSELEEQTKEILNLIEEDADSFAQRAEMYYKKRPEIVNLIENLYRSHRSLAEQYDQLRAEGRLHRTTSLNSTFSDRCWSMKLKDDTSKSSRASSIAYESEDSEVDDPELEEEIQVESKIQHEPSEKGCSVAKELNEEIERLKTVNKNLEAENEMLKKELLGKDEEKREVIRQLCLSMDILSEENDAMKNYIKKSKKWAIFNLKKLEMGVLSGKLFGGNPKVETASVDP